jgi:septal ring factor EnvC (AmiA/AmiB activator)
METEELPETSNPWPTVRWMAAALIFTGTVAVAIDQVKFTERAGAQKLEQAEAAVEKAKAETKEAQARVRALTSKLEQNELERDKANAALSRASNEAAQETRRASALQGLLDKVSEPMPVSTLSE